MPDLSRLRDERGFTMIVTILVLLVVMLFSVGAYSAAMGDLGSGSRTRDQKQIHDAAKAGASWYEAQLLNDPNYWTKCAAVPTVDGGASAPVLDHLWDGTGADPRLWRAVDPVNPQAGQYAVELIPANGKAACDPNDPTGSMIDTSTGTMRLRVSGRTAAVAGQAPTKRSVIVTLRRRGFLDFIYYTHREIMDPTLWFSPSQVNTSDPATSLARTWVNTNCTQTWAFRKTARFTGSIKWAGASTATAYTNYDLCGAKGNIQFASSDVIRGPFHSDDGILACTVSTTTRPKFGRDDQDAIEISLTTAQGDWRQSCSGGTVPPDWVGTYKPGAASIPTPPDNLAIQRNVTAGYLFTGATTIVLNPAGKPVGTMDVTNNGTTTNIAQPANGVIYVKSNNCTTTYDPNNITAPANCGDLTIKGVYTQSMTFGAEKDIIINGSLTRSGDKLLGLVGNQFVRVAHTCGNTSLANINIQAAILSTQYSFLVDNYWCDNLGNLNVTGAIAQNYRGVVGQSGSKGYIKNYVYDDRYRYRTPPKFLDPVQSGWRVVRVAEQVPAV
jgi:hypothetical protein